MTYFTRTPHVPVSFVLCTCIVPANGDEFSHVLRDHPVRQARRTTNEALRHQLRPGWCMLKMYGEQLTAPAHCWLANGHGRLQCKKPCLDVLGLAETCSNTFATRLVHKCKSGFFVRPEGRKGTATFRFSLSCTWMATDWTLFGHSLKMTIWISFWERGNKRCAGFEKILLPMTSPTRTIGCSRVAQRVWVRAFFTSGSHNTNIELKAHLQLERKWIGV